MNNRRNFLKSILAGGAASSGLATAAFGRNFDQPVPKKPEGATRILHITDLHIRPEHKAPERCKRLLQSALKQAGHVDMVFNGGDSIYAADYKNIKRERVLEQWKVWDDYVAAPLKGHKMVSALGNHDMWWATEKTEKMYGKPYVLQRLKQKDRYLGFDLGKWRVLVLDCNNGGLLDKEQESWYFKEIKEHKDKPLVILSHQPIMMGGSLLGNGMSGRQKELVNPLVEAKVEARPVHFVSGHIHVRDELAYKNVHFHCNGSVSGYWWEYMDSPGKDNSYEGTPMGYTIIDLYDDGSYHSHYHNATDAKDGKLLG
ncbi:3',5'-cyclic adenosine monophosphate phosphodiesterase CpdA [Rubritalea halochordaticola]|uniref:3',5'-cyclic adenosine monophosphate phosphodiesterase CpdA n=1 Tax=Rubritalea halochordaticola TaxID=714537 RepID=A0ABP9V3B0_9BACT